MIELLAVPMVSAIAESVVGVEPLIYACGAFRIDMVPVHKRST